MFCFQLEFVGVRSDFENVTIHANFQSDQPIKYKCVTFRSLFFSENSDSDTSQVDQFIHGGDGAQKLLSQKNKVFRPQNSA